MKIKKPRFIYLEDYAKKFSFNWIVVDSRKPDKWRRIYHKEQGTDWKHDPQAYLIIAGFLDEDAAEAYCNMLNGN